jgi:hypothetical protein
MYVKRLDLTLNPARTGDADPTRSDAVPAPPRDEGFYERSLELQALGEPLGNARGATRVVNGRPSRDGAWKSAVNIAVRRSFLNASTGSVFAGSASCGATVIDSGWALTAAHCLFDARLGGVKSVEWVTIYEGSSQFQRGRALRVAEVHVHDLFRSADQQLVNDLALLRLEKDSAVPRQKLAASRGVPAFLAEGTIATIVGWGNTDPDKSSPSPMLLQADVPIVSQTACLAIYPGIGQAAFCAGYQQGGTDTCQGDSGGPLFVAGSNGEPVQVGITSFGRGCAKPDAYGAYTNIGLYEQWIKERVPNPYFVMPASGASGPLGGIAGVKPGGPPAPHGQVAVDVRIVECTRANAPFAAANAGPAANRIRVGSCIRVDVTSGVTGYLGVFSRNANGKVGQLFPNHISGSSQVGATPSSVRAGRTVTIPGPGDGFDFVVSAPLGRAEIVAVVVPDDVGLPETTKPYRGLMRSVDDFDGELAAVVRQVEVKAHPTAARAVGTRQYDVVE